MAADFDPYYKWLGIPPEEQPANHYRLLAVNLFETDRDVIAAAANRQMAYLQQLASGRDLKQAQKLLGEVSQARVCLLNAKQKKAYDKQLRSALPADEPQESSEEEQPTEDPGPQAIQPLAARPTARRPTARKREGAGRSGAQRTHRQKKKQNIPLMVGVGGGAAAAVAILIVVLMSGGSSSAKKTARGKNTRAGKSPQGQKDERPESTTAAGPSKQTKAKSSPSETSKAKGKKSGNQTERQRKEEAEAILKAKGLTRKGNTWQLASLMQQFNNAKNAAGGQLSQEQKREFSTLINQHKKKLEEEAYQIEAENQKDFQTFNETKAEIAKLGTPSPSDIPAVQKYNAMVGKVNALVNKIKQKEKRLEYVAGVLHAPNFTPLDFSQEEALLKRDNPNLFTPVAASPQQIKELDDLKTAIAAKHRELNSDPKIKSALDVLDHRLGSAAPDPQDGFAQTDNGPLDAPHAQPPAQQVAANKPPAPQAEEPAEPRTDVEFELNFEFMEKKGSWRHADEGDLKAFMKDAKSTAKEFGVSVKNRVKALNKLNNSQSHIKRLKDGIAELTAQSQTEAVNRQQQRQKKQIAKKLPILNNQLKAANLSLEKYKNNVDNPDEKPDIEKTEEALKVAENFQKKIARLSEKYQGYSGEEREDIEKITINTQANSYAKSLETLRNNFNKQKQNLEAAKKPKQELKAAK